jgi:DNA repair and recombination protein RAD52
MFTDEQKAALAADLNTKNVKQRSQSGRQVSYIEGWHAIAEANRIFGFDGWERATIDMKCVAENERQIGAQKAPGWAVTYTAKVRVVVAGKDGQPGLVREGYGAGHGIDRDLGLAHESALKEAETDAMKRALMTFGNPFGLALYDKTQAHVSDCEPTAAQPEPPTKERLLAEIKQMTEDGDANVLKAWGKAAAPHIKAMPADDQSTIRAAYEFAMETINQSRDAA